MRPGPVIPVSALLIAAAAFGDSGVLLDGTWMIATDPHNVGREQRWFEVGPVSGARPIQVPGILESVFPGYDGVVWYWRSFDVAPAAPAERLILKFHAADYLADVWLNGQHVGRHEGGETPFSFDVTEVMQPSANRLAVRLLNPGENPVDGVTLNETPRSIKFVPMRVGVFWNCGGLWQSVEILRVPVVRVVDLFVVARPAGGRVSVHVTVQNDTGRAAAGRLRLEIAPATQGAVIAGWTSEITLRSGANQTNVDLSVPGARSWSPEAPVLYRLTARLESTAAVSSHTVRFGFRHFTFRDGYFRLNGKRIYLKSAHSTGHFPIGQHAAYDPEWLRRELIYAKAMGFNCVRMIAKMMYPGQLDLCDELGLLVYQESFASWGSAGSWGIKDEAAMRDRFDRSVREMILRDRNHPSIVMWGLLNETRDGPLFRHALGMLPLVRAADPSRIVMLNSGRWDGQWSTGSLSVPWTGDWQHTFGSETPGAAAVDVKQIGDLNNGAGDLHRYPSRPWQAEETRFFRTVGAGRKGIFLSEYGNGSQIDAARLVRLFEQYGASPQLDDARLYYSMYNQLERDWKRWGLDSLFASPSEIVRAGEAIHSTQRGLALDAIRANPRIIGFNITGLTDQCVEGEGLLTTFREPKKGVFEAMLDALAPVRWSVFVEPVHLYRGDRIRVEAVLVNEDVLRPGEYPVRLRIAGPSGVVFDKASNVIISDRNISPDPPIALPVFDEQVTLAGPAGKYEVTASFERGAASVGRKAVLVGEPKAVPQAPFEVTVWEDRPVLGSWLSSRGATIVPFDASRPERRGQPILVGEIKGSPVEWQEVAARVKRGSVAVLLDASAAASLNLPGKLERSAGMYWGRDDIVIPHRAFDGLPTATVMDLLFYRDLVPEQSFVAFDASADVVVPCFAVGRPRGDGYWSGANMLVHAMGDGKIVTTTLRLLENLGRHPAADRIVLNLAAFAAAAAGGNSK